MLFNTLIALLSFSALQVRVNPGSVTEGQSVTLTCSTTCTLTGSPAFTWFRDGSPLSFTTQRHQLTASSEDGGTYSCAVKGSELLPSPAVALTVNYPPKSTSVSVSGQYYCEAKNTHGAQNSTALLLTAQEPSWNSAQTFCRAQNTHGAANAVNIKAGDWTELVCAAVGSIVTLALIAVIMWTR
ncbi:hypothetical protein COCON_G00001660 [Conger conger]|uniref:Ig-like domain-containing protein n=1 Tax=Conger conger TaxID=82655 RepID=A0A9Q1E0R1_CONCO|nr:hypothetical protein COCON_G00001660 [Conger conger]